MPQNPSETLKKLSSNTFGWFYWLQGEESWFVDQISNYIIKNAIEPAHQSFNQTVCYGKDMVLEQVLADARRYPFMSERLLIVVREAQEMSDLFKPEGAKLLSKYLEQPCESTILVFALKNKRLEANKALYKQIDKAGSLTESPIIPEYKTDQLCDFVAAHAMQMGYSVQKNAQHWLVENTGNNLYRLAHETEKVVANFSPGHSVVLAQMQEFASISKEYNIFELQRALAAKNGAKAYKIIDFFASDTKSHPALMHVSSLFGYFQKVLMGHYATDKSENALAILFQTKPFLVRDYVSAMKGFSVLALFEVISALKHADLQLKGIEGSGSEKDVMKELVFKILYSSKN